LTERRGGLLSIDKHSPERYNGDAREGVCNKGLSETETSREYPGGGRHSGLYSDCGNQLGR